eukprot:gnl/MRDRNA2_/MRDRNA2_33918_c0_seq1.p2 gnl/MRDRNA2_/MRDRNA2_33918_c0~~gnl/MRDRNA2_/MRDRNA2_33918_c0_seq1.p2  ORF type:complete len:214 (-),score=68.72 gnl/MRDRNA2_/MRDRNA2_33918_c0_seq1:252-893(-)
MSDQDLAGFVAEPTGGDPFATPAPPSADGLLGFTGEPAAYAPPAMGGDSLDMPTPAAPAVISPGGMAAMSMGGEDPFSGVPVPSGDSFGSMGGGMIPEMTALREWEEKHERELEEIMRKEESDKKQRREKAKEDIAAWYDERKTNNTKKAKSNREEEATLEAARAEAMKPGANPWERIVDLIDTNAQAGDSFRDTSRMRTLLISLKNSPPVAA